MAPWRSGEDCQWQSEFSKLGPEWSGLPQMRAEVVRRDSTLQTNSIISMAPWRSGYAEVCKTFYTGSIPVGASIWYYL